ncbi:CYTH and CHAD domain-containing protein [Tessaracoccus sp. G1721]
MTGSDEADPALGRERRFVVPDGASPPSLEQFGATGPAQRLRLTAEYFDTPDGALARAGAALRRRTGGAEDGWRLTTTMSDGGVLEHNLPAGPLRRIPAALRAPVADIVGMEPLLPVLRLRARRRLVYHFSDAGRMRLAVAVDRITARPGGGTAHWCELGLSLSPGEPPSTLEDAARLLAGAGLRPATRAPVVLEALGPAVALGPARGHSAAAAVLHVLRGEYGRFQALEALIASDEPDAVHRARVALRRMRSVLMVFGSTLKAADATALLDELRWAGALLGGPRDTEVLLELVDELAADTDTALTAAIHERVAAHLAARHDEARGRLLTAMATPRWDALHERIVCLLVTSKPARAGKDRAPRQLGLLAGRAERRVERRRTRAVLDPANPVLWHTARKAAKAARYAREVTADLPGAGRSERERADAWKEVTDALGRFQDLAIARELIAEMAPATPDGSSDQATLLAGLDALAEQRLGEAQTALVAVSP